MAAFWEPTMSRTLMLSGGSRPRSRGRSESQRAREARLQLEADAYDRERRRRAELGCMMVEREGPILGNSVKDTQVTFCLRDAAHLRLIEAVDLWPKSYDTEYRPLYGPLDTRGSYHAAMRRLRAPTPSRPTDVSDEGPGMNNEALSEGQKS